METPSESGKIVSSPGRRASASDSPGLALEMIKKLPLSWKVGDLAWSDFDGTIVIVVSSTRRRLCDVLGPDCLREELNIEWLSPLHYAETAANIARRKE